MMKWAAVVCVLAFVLTYVQGQEKDPRTAQRRPPTCDPSRIRDTNLREAVRSAISDNGDEGQGDTSSQGRTESPDEGPGRQKRQSPPETTERPGAPSANDTDSEDNSDQRVGPTEAADSQIRDDDDGATRTGGNNDEADQESSVQDTEEASTILARFGDIPVSCRQRVQTWLRNGRCERENVQQALCRNPGEARELFRCLSQADKCAAIIGALNAEDCIPQRHKCRLGRMLLELNCQRSGVDVRYVACPESARLLRNLNEQELRTMLTSLGRATGEPSNCGAAQALGAALDRHYRRIDTAQLVTQLRPVLPYLSSRTCNRITPQALVESLGEIGNLPWDCRSEREQRQAREGSSSQRHCVQTCGRVIAQKLTGGRTPAISTSDQAAVRRLGRLSRCLRRDQAKAMANAGNCQAAVQIAENSNNPRLTDAIQRACRPQRQPSQFTQEDVNGLGTLFCRLNYRDLQEVPSAIFCSQETKDLCREMRNPPGFLRSLFGRRCLPQSLTPESIVDVGGAAALRARASSLRELDDDTLTDNRTVQALRDGARELRENRRRGASTALSRMAQRVSQRAETLRLYASERSIIRNVALGDLERVAGTAEELAESEPDLSPAQNRRMMERRGDPPAARMTVDNVERLNSLVGGFQCREIRELGSEYRENRLGIAKRLCRYDRWKGKALICLHSLIMEALRDQNETRPMSALTQDDVSEFHPRCVVMFRREEIEAASREVCRDICSKIGDFDRLSVVSTPARRVRVRDACLRCLGKSGNEELSEEEVDVMGRLLAAGDGEAIRRVPNEVLRSRASVFRRTCMNAAATNELAGRLENAVGNAPTEEDIQNLGELSSLLPLPAIEAATTAIADNADEIDGDLEEADEEDDDDDDDENEERACRNSLSEEDRRDRDRRRNNTRTMLANSIRNTRTQERRRKRSTTVMYCSDVEAMGSSAPSMTVAEINAMDNTEFSNCLQTFSEISTWSTEQRNALLEKVKTAVGALCSLTGTQLESLGSIALAMTTNDIQCLNLENDITVSDLGSMKSWAENQLEALANRFMALRPSLTPATLTADHISTLGYILCGLSPEAIRQIPHAVYSTSSSSIGLLKTCPVSKLRALKDLATHSSVFGPVPSWPASTYSAVGIVLGGLTGGELSTADPADIEGWRTHGIAHIPASELRHMSVSQLESLSRTQSLALSHEQKSELSLDQRNALIRAADGEDAQLMTTLDNNKDGAGAFHISTTLLMLCAALWWWIQ